MVRALPSGLCHAERLRFELAHKVWQNRLKEAYHQPFSKESIFNNRVEGPTAVLPLNSLSQMFTDHEYFVNDQQCVTVDKT